MITEDYVSYEVAKLLKEKGFNEYCLKNYWSSDKELHDWKWELSYNRNSDENRNTKDCAAPTHQMAMKWLREEKNIFIVIEPHAYDYINEKNSSYVYSLWQGDNYYENPELKSYSSYEEAVEAALKYTLENLI